MAIEMWKGQVSEIVDNKIVRQRLKDGWTFEVDFEGKVVGDTLKGAFYPGDVLVTGKAVKD